MEGGFKGYVVYYMVAEEMVEINLCFYVGMCCSGSNY